MTPDGRVAIFGPHPMLSITIEPLTADGGDDIHAHAAGQGVWVARMVAELGARPVLCGFIGGETGTVLRPLLEEMPAELRLVGDRGGQRPPTSTTGARASAARSPRAPACRPPVTRSTTFLPPPSRRQ